MKEPCRMCGSRNWCGRPCANAPAPAEPATVERSNTVRPTGTRFDKKAYQRDYMRKVRAEKNL